jgi:hypothetical protein
VPQFLAPRGRQHTRDAAQIDDQRCDVAEVNVDRKVLPKERDGVADASFVDGDHRERAERHRLDMPILQHTGAREILLV